jgi:endo-1,4-beta-xylanase
MSNPSFFRFVILVLVTSLAISTSLGQDKKSDSKKKKKAPEPFQWVNPMTKWELKKFSDVKSATFKSPSLKVDIGYCIYLPPGYNLAELKEKRYPVVYYLHGGRPGNEKKGIRLVAQIDKQIGAKKVAPMIYVFVNGGPVSHYNMPNDPKSQGADVFIKELIPHVDATYRTIAKREGRGLEGFSQGGRGTARLMFRYPELFCSASPGGGGHETEKKISENGGAESNKLKFAEGDNTWDLARQYAANLKKSKSKQQLKILVHVGDKGFNYQNNLLWMKHLTSLGIEHQKIIVPGVGHSAIDIYAKNGIDIIKFHAANFEAAKQ